MKQTLIKPAYEIEVHPPYTLSYDDKITRDALRLAQEEFKGNNYAIPEYAISSTVNLDSKKDFVQGSSWYFANILASKISKLTNSKVRPVNAREIQLFLRHNLIPDASSTFDDEGFTVNPRKGAKPKLHNHFTSQLTSENWRSKFEHVDRSKPYLITGLIDVSLDDNFEYGLKVDFNEFSEVYNHNSLVKGGNFDSNDPGLINDGLPSRLGQGIRTLYIGDGDVCRFIRNRNLDLIAGNDNLASSYDTGRMRLVEIFSSGNDGLISKIEQENLELSRELEKRERALKILREN